MECMENNFPDLEKSSGFTSTNISQPLIRRSAPLHFIRVYQLDPLFSALITSRNRPGRADAPTSLNKFSFRKTYGHRAVISMRATNEK